MIPTTTMIPIVRTVGSAGRFVWRRFVGVDTAGGGVEGDAGWGVDGWGVVYVVEGRGIEGVEETDPELGRAAVVDAPPCEIVIVVGGGADDDDDVAADPVGEPSVLATELRAAFADGSDSD